MTALSMCRDRKCPSRVGCLRYRAEPSYRQSYFMPHRFGAERCSYYTPTEGVGGIALRDHVLADLDNEKV